MEVIKTLRGGDKLCLDGYMYVKKRSYNNWIRWTCSLQRSAGCKGGLTTDDSYNPRSSPDRNGIEVTKVRTTMKAQAKESRMRPNQLLSQALLQATDDVQANMLRRLGHGKISWMQLVTAFV